MEKAIKVYLEQTYDEMYANTSLPNAERERCLRLISDIYNSILHTTKFYMVFANETLEYKIGEDCKIESGNNYITHDGYTCDLKEARYWDSEAEAREWIKEMSEYWDARVVEVVKIGNTLIQL